MENKQPDLLQNRPHLLEQLRNLNPDTPPIFGKMTAQHMVEHLSYTLRFANGKLPQELLYRPDKAEKFKQYTIYSEQELQPGFRAPMLPEELLPLKHPGMQEAVQELEQELQDMDRYFAQNPEARPVSPTLGELTQAEWYVFHNKHFRHHFRQFGLL